MLVCMMAASVSGFAPRAPLSVTRFAKTNDGAQSVRMMARKADAAASKFWEGDWVCADCGYIYDKNIFGGRYFEEQTFGFKCPQCSGPRRRYAKMVGNTVGVTLDGGDGPILFWSGFGFILTIIFGVWATNDFPGL